MKVNEEQKRRMEANRAAALARRLSAKQKAQPDVLADPSNPSKHSLPNPLQLNTNGVKRFEVASGKPLEVLLEICQPTQFAVMLKGIIGDQFHHQAFFETVLSVLPCENLDHINQRLVFNLKDYEKLTDLLKSMQGVTYQPVPWPTRMPLEKAMKASENGVPITPSGVTDTEAEELLRKLPLHLKENLLPFQKEGVKYSLKRGGRCLLADEMGVGKTIQAIAMAACYREEGPLLVVCPASMRLVWADELERWLPFLSPLDVHLVFGRKNDLVQNIQPPQVVVISYFMLARLRRSMVSHKWGMLIVDESHNLRCTMKKAECEETEAVLELAETVKRVVLLSGTPSLSKPFDIYHQVNCLWQGLLGKNKYEFAKTYCGVSDKSQPRPYGQGGFKDYTKGTRLQELNVLLKQTVMLRRLKEDVLAQLPPKRRQVICLQLAPVDIQDAKAFTASMEAQRNMTRKGGEACKCGFTEKGLCDCEEEMEDENDDVVMENTCVPRVTSARSLGSQEIGVAKLRGFREWLLNNSIFASNEVAETDTELGKTQQKMIIFAHHHKVLDSIQEIVQSKGVEFVRVDGTTPSQERLKNVNHFQSDSVVKVAIIGVTAGGVGLNFSAAQSVVFVELPKSASEMLQAEDRAHRRGQKNAVNIYIFCAKETTDEAHWQSLRRSLERVSTMTDGVETSLEVDSVIDITKPHMQVETRVPMHSKDNTCTRSMETTIDCSSEDSCITSDTCEGVSSSEVNHVPDSVTRCTSRTFCNEDRADREGVSSVTFPAHCLMFEVSRNTGRIHLFLNSADGTSQPISLQENFKPEDLAHFKESGSRERGALPNCLVDSIVHRDAATSFWEQWMELRPIFRTRLLGRPLLLPLSAELSCLKMDAQYGPGGIIKGGSKRRHTPKEEAGCAPPEGATWKSVSFHKRAGLKESHVIQAWNAEGNPLCKFCQHPCEGYRSKKPESFEDLFCKRSCSLEYSTKTSRRFARQELFSLEAGVCVVCKLDCHSLVDRIRPLPVHQRRTYILEKAPQFNKHKNLLENLTREPSEGNAWHADHILAVADGGGECTLENLRTLCVVCHAKVTADQARRRRSEHLKTKRGLQMTIKKLFEKSQQNKRLRTSSAKGTTLSDGREEMVVDYSQSDLSGSDDDKELLDITIAGSAYSASAPGTYTKPTEVAPDLQKHMLTISVCPPTGSTHNFSIKVAGSAHSASGVSTSTQSEVALDSHKHVPAITVGGSPNTIHGLSSELLDNQFAAPYSADATSTYTKPTENALDLQKHTPGMSDHEAIKTIYGLSPELLDIKVTSSAFQASPASTSTKSRTDVALDLQKCVPAMTVDNSSKSIHSFSTELLDNKVAGSVYSASSASNSTKPTDVAKDLQKHDVPAMSDSGATESIHESHTELLDIKVDHNNCSSSAARLSTKMTTEVAASTCTRSALLQRSSTVLDIKVTEPTIEVTLHSQKHVQGMSVCESTKSIHSSSKELLVDIKVAESAYSSSATKLSINPTSRVAVNSQKNVLSMSVRESTKNMHSSSPYFHRLPTSTETVPITGTKSSTLLLEIPMKKKPVFSLKALSQYIHGN